MPTRVQRPAPIWIAALLTLGATVSSAGDRAADSRTAPIEKATPVAPDLYERVEARLAAQPELAAALGNPAPEMASLAWLVGSWSISARVLVEESAGAEGAGKADHGTSEVRPILGGTWLEIADTYPEGNQDLGFVTYDLVHRRFQAVSLDSFGNAVTTTGAGWDGDRLVFTGDVEILGEGATLRQIFVKTSDRSYAVINEERMPDGSWRTLDRYDYVKR
jgi:hypothetical protein